MGRIILRGADRRQLSSLGITEDRMLAQIEIFRRPSCTLHLSRPCTIGDGVHRILKNEIERYLQLHEVAAQGERFIKFIPASGAASRMFQSLLQIHYMPQFLEIEELHHRAGQGVAVACDFLKFLNGLYLFPFVGDLEKVLAADGFSLSGLVRKQEYRTILEYLLTERGLDYANLPKGLLKFHRYPDECRTAFEEHLAESAFDMGKRSGKCRVHFTVSHEHEEKFKSLMERVRACYEDRFGTSFEIGYSFQKTSTNTIAVDMDNRPFRDQYGRLHFRPGGHGALLENLNDLNADLVYVKNVDNLCPDRHKDHIVFWKKVLAGCLVEIQDAVHGILRNLTHAPLPEILHSAESCLRERLLMPFPAGYAGWPLQEKQDLLISRLNRPIRVCGVVPNSGEPGGAPFWVKDTAGETSIQIVEKPQVDFDAVDQREIWMASTHFNPVDLVCGVRDYQGRNFDLRKYVDHDAVFITKKSKDGKDLKALELPGLWNGGMADWITYIVEVPRITFNPVKSVFDLLRPEHQPEEY